MGDSLFGKAVKLVRKLVSVVAGKEVFGVPTIALGTRAPVFMLNDLEGRPCRIPDVASHESALLVFFKVSCPTCQFTFPFLERLWGHYCAPNLKMWGIVQDSPAAGKLFANQYGITFPIVVDPPEYVVSSQFGISAVPTIFFLEQGGWVRRSIAGFHRQELVELAKELSKVTGRPYKPLFEKDESVPEFKPG